MWKGLFSPDMTKRYCIAWFDPFNVSDDTLENIDPDSDLAEGTINVMFGPYSQVYSWLATYQNWQDFEASGFDSSWLVERGVVGPGGWGWPYGRTTHTGGKR